MGTQHRSYDGAAWESLWAVTPDADPAPGTLESRPGDAFWGSPLFYLPVAILLLAVLVSFGIIAAKHKALRGEREKLLAILSNTGDLLAAMDEDYNILFMNGSFVDMIGDATGEKCYKVFCNADEPCSVNCAVDEIIHKKKDSFVYTHSVPEDVRAGRYRAETIQANPELISETVARPFTYRGKRCVLEVSRDIGDRKRAEAEREKLIAELQDALQRIKTLGGLLPICASCKKIRDDRGYWTQVEDYIREHTEAEFSHSVCPECLKKLYPKYYSDEE